MQLQDTVSVKLPDTKLETGDYIVGDQWSRTPRNLVLRIGVKRFW
jgi:hypothetical protein